MYVYDYFVDRSTGVHGQKAVFPSTCILQSFLQKCIRNLSTVFGLKATLQPFAYNFHLQYVTIHTCYCIHCIYT